jgi:hypothetical protein
MVAQLLSRTHLKQAVQSALAGRDHNPRTRWPLALLAGGAAALVAADTAPFSPVFELSSLLPQNGGNGTTGFVMSSANRNSTTGQAVSAAGDVNGDGVGDVLVGAPWGNGYAGDTFVVFGRLTPFGATMPLATLLAAHGGDGSAGFVVHGETPPPQQLGLSGSAVQAAGDVNGDGIDDLLIGAPLITHGDASYGGAAYLVFGRVTGFPPEIELSDLLVANGGDGSTGVVFKGSYFLEGVGWSVSAGDVNDDGINDVLFTTFEPLERAYVVFGSATGFPAEFEFHDLLPANGGDGSAGFVVVGDSFRVSIAGDVNNDGIDDVILGSPGADPNGVIDAGRSYVVFGRATASPAEVDVSSLLAANGGDGSTGFVVNGIDADDISSWSVSKAGDVNGDGVADMIIGARFADPNDRNAAGEAYVVFGRPASFPAEVELSGLLAANGGDGTEGFVIQGIDRFDYAGYAVSGARDINGDGLDDLIIGAPGPTINTDDIGDSYVVFGRRTGFPAELDLTNLLAEHGGNGSVGFVLAGIALRDQSGHAVSAAGDVNGDGFNDLLISAYFAHGGAGEAYIVFGRSSFDLDFDGVPNDLDNCVARSNSDQRDTDSDDLGNVCDADLNNDCLVNFTDLGALKVRFFSDDPDADFNGDGVVNFVDLAAMKSAFFQAPGPSGVLTACIDK